MLLLTIDTTLTHAAIALVKDDKIIASKNEKGVQQQAESLIANIESLLNETELSYDGLEAVAVNIGPGSFTGIRIGLAAARGLALAADVPVIAVTGFELLHQQAKTAGIALANIAVAINAKRGQWFVKICDEAGELQEEDRLVEGIKLDKIAKRQIRYNLERVVMWPDDETPSLYYPDNLSFAEIASSKMRKRVFPIAAPLYIRPPDAKKQKESV